MTIVSLNLKDLEKEIGKITPEVENKISMFGTPIESITDEEIEIDVTPNRPDLLSMQGFIRAIKPFLEGKKISHIKINKPEKNYNVFVDKSVKEVRPFTSCAIIKNLKLNDKKIKEIIDIQEKLHNTYGRKRKKVAIGIYPLEKIKLPIKFVAKKPEEIKFRPLGASKDMTGLQILSQHPVGRDYAHLLEDYKKFPVFIDANENILSMPPIINSHETGKVSEETKDFFVECSGSNLPYINKTLNILVAIFSDMGGDVYQMRIEDATSFISPDMNFSKMKLKLEDINKTLGVTLTEKEIKNSLRKMQIEYDKGTALIPPFRTDILHWIDLVGDVSIGYGYENFTPEIPEISTIAEEDKTYKLKRKISDILTGLGFLECSSYHLTTKEDFKKSSYDFKNFIEVEESKTEYSILRPNLMTNILKIISENSDSFYPQKIFEAGRIFEISEPNKKIETGIIEKENLSIALANEKVSFTELKQALDYLMRMLDKEYKIEECEDINFIIGRVGKIIYNNKEIGILGELSPRVLKNWGINNPVVLLEINLDELQTD